jgi:hypothetical protein
VEKPKAEKRVAKPKAEPSVEPVTETAPDADLPEKYRGKSAKEIADWHRSLETEKGRMANELGQLRKTVDELLAASFRATNPDTKPSKKKRDPVTSDKLLTDPEAAITETAKDAVKDDMEATSDRVSKLEFDAAQRDFLRDFPDAQTRMADQSFVDWVKASPYRLSLAAQAHQGSFLAARELFGIHNEIRDAQKAAKPEETKKPDPKDVANAASTVKPSGSTSPAAREATAARKVAEGPKIKRAAIRKEYISNRTEYMRKMQPGGEYNLAYTEGRVID